MDSIDKRLLENLDQDDGVHGPWASLARRPGVVCLLSVSGAGPLNARVKLADGYVSNRPHAATSGRFPAHLYRSGGKPNINNLSDGAASAGNMSLLRG